MEKFLDYQLAKGVMDMWHAFKNIKRNARWLKCMPDKVSIYLRRCILLS